MSLINYPDNGLYEVVEDSLNDCSKSLSDAVSRCTYSIPSSFQYLNYVKTLPSLLNGYVYNVKGILATAKSIDINFKIASESIESIVKETSLSVIDERERLVK